VTYLLDVNVLLALLWRDHDEHVKAVGWLSAIERFATCPLVQLGFARISSHSQLGYCATPESAFSLLRRFVASPRHIFIADTLDCQARVLHTERMRGPQNVTDFYLVALARQHGFSLATFDHGLSAEFADENGLVTYLARS
jgi:toxin-antitoxin system PIN domain toxin